MPSREKDGPDQDTRQNPSSEDERAVDPHFPIEEDSVPLDEDGDPQIVEPPPPVGPPPDHQV